MFQQSQANSNTSGASLGRSQAVILAGGLGSRLRGVLPDKPKPMALINGRPVLEHQITTLHASGVRDVVLCVGHLADVIQRYFGDGAKWGLQIRYAIEKQLLGTAGAINNARDLLDDVPFLAMNGDTLIPGIDVTDLVCFHCSRAAASPLTVGTLVVVRPPDRGAYGVLELDLNETRIARFREKAPAVPRGAVVSAGMYVLEPRVFRFVPDTVPSSLEYEVFPAVLASGGHLWAYRHQGFFGDIGTPAGLQRVRRYVARQTKERKNDHSR